MSIVKTIRINDWWLYKIPSILSIAYATALTSSYHIYFSIPRILFLFAALIFGAIYASIVNDATDINIDRISGKINRMENLSKKTRILLIVGCLAIGSIFSYFLYNDKISFYLSLLPWLAFSLYSIPPVRLKDKKIWGVIACAMGEHVLPNAIMVSSINYYFNENINLYWFFLITLWSLCYGLRVIMAHQFLDQENDSKAGVNTFVSSLSFQILNKLEIIILILEIITLLLILIYLNFLVIYIFLVVYIIIAIIRFKRFKNKISIIITPKKDYYQYIFSDYYIFLFPVAILCAASIHDPKNLYILAAHILIFPKQLLILSRDLFVFIKYPKA
jgi:4-hydroxybenzoate polyprenyltransferase